MPVEFCFNKLHGFNLFNSGMTVKSSMQHFSSAEIHPHMEDEFMTKKGDHIALFCLVSGNFYKTAPPLFLLPMLKSV